MSRAGSWLRMAWSRCCAALSRERLDREFDEELTTHLELLIDEGLSRGLSAADARRLALQRLGRPEVLRETYREQRGIDMVDKLLQDLKYSLRMLWKTPVFTAVIALSLALGIGANTALFSLVDDLLLRSLPVRDPDRLVQVRQVGSRWDSGNRSMHSGRRPSRRCARTTARSRRSSDSRVWIDPPCSSTASPIPAGTSTRCR